MRPGTAAVLDVFLDLLLVGLLLLAWINAAAPGQDLLWRPLRLSDPIGLATPAKLAALRLRPGRCAAFLRREHVAFTPAPLPERPPACGAPDAVRLAASASRLSPASPVMDCPLAAAYLVWERGVVERTPGAKVLAVEHVGTYACRTVAGSDTVSQHARARAIDVTGLRFADGSRAEVGRDWTRDTPAGRRLHRMRGGACGLFAGVLSPDYNAAHATHLHLDVGPWGVCR